MEGKDLSSSNANTLLYLTKIIDVRARVFQKFGMYIINVYDVLTQIFANSQKVQGVLFTHNVYTVVRVPFVCEYELNLII